MHSTTRSKGMHSTLEQYGYSTLEVVVVLEYYAQYSSSSMHTSQQYQQQQYAYAQQQQYHLEEVIILKQYAYYLGVVFTSSYTTVVCIILLLLVRSMHSTSGVLLLLGVRVFIISCILCMVWVLNYYAYYKSSTNTRVPRVLCIEYLYYYTRSNTTHRVQHSSQEYCPCY